MRNYETMLVLNADLDKDTIEALLEELSTLITDNGGEVVEVDEWGTRELAYEINDLTRGYYAVINFKAVNETLKELDRVSKLREGVIRYLTLKDE